MNSPIVTEYQERFEVETYNPPDETVRLVTYVREQYKRGQKAKKDQVRKAAEGQAFLTGKHSATWDDTNQRAVEPIMEEGDVRVPRNVTRSIVEAQSAKCTENRPSVTVQPATESDEDADRSRASEHLLDFLWDELDLQGLSGEFSKMLFSEPIAYFKTSWDVEAGEEYTLEQGSDEERILEDEVDPGEIEAARAKSGFPRVDVLSCREVGISPGAKRPDLKDARWAYHAASRHIDEVRSWYPETGKYVSPTHTMQEDDDRVRLSYDYQEDTADQVLVVEYYEKGSIRHPAGFCCTIAGNVLLDYLDELPHGELPFCSARHNSVPGQLYGDGTITDLIPMQKQLNLALSNISMQAALMSNGVWLVAKGSVVEEISTRQGQIIEYDPRYPPPRQAPAAPLSPVHGQIVIDMTDSMKGVSGATDVMLGAVPSGISGRAIGLLADRDATLLGPTVREIERAQCLVASRLLRLWRDHMPIPVTLRVVGIDGATEVLEFHSADINSTHVRIAPNSSLPKHISYRREQIQSWMQAGVLGDPRDPQTAVKARKLLEFGALDKLYGDRSRDRVYAKEENRMLSQGEVFPKPTGVDDHATHIDAHLDYVYSAAYRLLHPETQHAFLWHIAWHYYLESQGQSGTPWWGIQVGDYPTMPPSEAPGQQAAPGPGGAPSPAAPMKDAYGPDPSVDGGSWGQQARVPVGTMDPAQAAYYMQQMQEAQAAQEAPPMTETPSVHGPGVPDMEHLGRS